MNAIKFYQVKPEDINDYGELNPDAELIPQFAQLYNAFPGSRPETYSSVDIYDNKTNVHPGRHFNIYDKDGVPIKKNSRSIKRGYSTIGYLRGREKYDNWFDGWAHFDPTVSKEDFDKQKKKYNSTFKNNVGDYELNRITHIHQPVRRDSYRYRDRDLEPDLFDDMFNDMFNERDDVSDLSNIMESARYGKDTVYDHNSKGTKTIHLPFIVSADDDDIVSLDDVLNKGYDPGRDFRQIEEYLKKVALDEMSASSDMDFNTAYNVAKLEVLEGVSDIDINGIYNYAQELKSYQHAYETKGGSVIQVNHPDWREFLRNNFDISDSENISDKHLKYIIHDASEHIKNKRKWNDIVQIVKRR